MASKATSYEAQWLKIPFQRISKQKKYSTFPILPSGLG
jgi:hypothetical protein